MVTFNFQGLLCTHAEYLLMSLGARLVNDDDATCKKKCAKCIKVLITRVPNNQYNNLYDCVLSWLEDKKVRILSFEYFFLHRLNPLFHEH